MFTYQLTTEIKDNNRIFDRRGMVFFLCFSYCKSMGANDPRGRAIFDPRGMVGRIYKGEHYTLLHTKYESSGPCGIGQEDFFMFFPWRLPEWSLY